MFKFICMLIICDLIWVPMNGMCAETIYDETAIQDNVAEVAEIDVSVTIEPIRDSKYCFVFNTNDRNQMTYILHLLNAMSLVDDGKLINGADIPIVNINIVKNNEDVSKIGFINGRFYDETGKQYSVDAIEYGRFVTFIYALKTGDVSFEPSKWAEEYVEIAIENNLLPKWFRIDYNKNITRMEFCQLADNFLSITGTQSDSENFVSPPFSDAADAGITSLWNKGVINGKSETEFCPYDYITREEAAKILSGLCDAAGIEMNGGTGVDYADKDQISDWAVDYVEDMTDIGVFNGDDENKFNPQDNITKEELISILVRLNDNAQANIYQTGAIYVNDIKINGKETILTRDGEVFIPLRTVLEALGSEVTRDENTEDIYFNYANTEYICVFAALNSHFPEEKYLLISKVENKGSAANSDYIQLNPMSADGAYCEINDRIYLYPETAERLLDTLGCNVEIETDPLVLKISTK